MPSLLSLVLSIVFANSANFGGFLLKMFLLVLFVLLARRFLLRRSSAQRPDLVLSFDGRLGTIENQGTETATEGELQMTLATSAPDGAQETRAERFVFVAVGPRDKKAISAHVPGRLLRGSIRFTSASGKKYVTEIEEQNGRILHLRK